MITVLGKWYFWCILTTFCPIWWLLAVSFHYDFGDFHFQDHYSATEMGLGIGKVQTPEISLFLLRFSHFLKNKCFSFCYKTALFREF